MYRRLVPLIVLLSVAAIGVVFPETREEAISRLRIRITEYGEMLIEGYGEKGFPNPGPLKKLKLDLLKEPQDLVREAADFGIREGSRAERIGASAAYTDLIGFKHEPINPAYRSLMLRRLAEDDMHDPLITMNTTGFLIDYPSKETLAAVMDAAARAPTAEVRECAIMDATGMLDVNLPIDDRSTPLQKAKALSDFEAWYRANKSRIRFNSKGEPRIGGTGSMKDSQKLAPEDRERIRRDPSCVLQLAEQGFSDAVEENNARVKELNNRCGVALFGAEGAAVVSKGLAASEEGSPPSLDLQAEMVSAQGKYPVMDAILLAVAYVAAYDSDSAHRGLAKRSLEQFGSPDIPRILKGEPKLVREKME